MADATPTSSGLSTTAVTGPGTPYIDALIGGDKWGDGVGTGVTITYSIPTTSIAAWAPSGSIPGISYGNPGAWEPSGASPLTDVEAAYFREALQAWSDVANITFQEVADSPTVVGDIRVSFSTIVGSNNAGYAYLPNAFFPNSGDIWLNPTQFTDQESIPGNYGFETFMHELGHALGLSHPGDQPYDPGYSVQTTIMSYNSWENDLFRRVTGSEASGYEFQLYSISTLTPSIYDIDAIQYLYGANTSFHTGDDVYSFDPTTPFFKTLWDAGGNDTISVSNFSNSCTIDLTAGHFSSIAVYSDPLPLGYVADTSPTYYGTNNLGIAFNCAIENAIGGIGTDTLIGNALGNDLKGLGGADTLSGGGGIDTLTGGGGNDLLNGGGGIDVMAGGRGNDTYVVNLAGETVTELAGEGMDLVKVKMATADGSYTLPDEVENGTLVAMVDFSLVGNAGDNLLTGNALANGLDGAGGADTLVGGLGDDTYFIGNLGVTVTELPDQGTDTVLASINYSLTADVERLTLTGTATSGRGNSLDNVIVGNDGDNMLNGKGGADNMSGGLGNDSYVVNHIGDLVTEIAGQGIDSVQSSITYKLTPEVDNLTLTGLSAINAAGNGLDNVLIGNSANNTLKGGLGNDTLTGGGGADKFVFKTALDGLMNVDTITDFTAGSDKLVLDHLVFASLAAGSLNATTFVAEAAATAHDANDFILYDTTTGNLYYDADGSGAGGTTLFATSANHASIASLTSSDFQVV